MSRLLFNMFAVIGLLFIATPKVEAQSITGINVQVKKVYVRTSTGQVISIPNSAQSLDLADMAAGDGVALTIPGSSSVSVSEIILSLQGGHKEVDFEQGRSCKLKAPNSLSLVTASPLLLDANVPYIVHAAFTALNMESNRGGHLKCELAGDEFEITGVDFGG